MAELDGSMDAAFGELDRANAPGLMVAVAQGSSPAILRGYGRANVEFDVPWAADTRYRIASVTKQFVGTAMLLLEDQGRLTLADDIRTYLPEMPSYGPVITIRHLLTMTSGLKLDEDLAIGFNGDVGPQDLGYLFRLVTRLRGLNFPPGHNIDYSDTNYRLAALIIERVTDNSFERVMGDLIFGPLGMTDTSAPPEYTVVQDQLAYLYHVLPDGPLHRNEEGAAMSGDGAMISTVADLLRWNEHLRNGLLGGPSLLERWTMAATLANGARTAYGLGIGIRRLGDWTVWEHSGLFGSYFARVPERDLAVVMFCNRTDRNATSLGRQALAACLFDGDSNVPAPAPPDDESAGTAACLAGRWVELERGYLLEISGGDGVLRVGRWGNPLRAVANGRYETEIVEPRPWLAIESTTGDPDAIDVDLTLGSLHRFQRVAATPIVAEPSDYVGTYLSGELESAQVVRLEPDGSLTLVLGRGQSPLHRLAMSPLGHDTFMAESSGYHYRAPRIVAKFVRDAGGRVRGAIEHLESSRDLEFTRLDDEPPMGGFPSASRSVP